VALKVPVTLIYLMTFAVLRFLDVLEAQ